MESRGQKGYRKKAEKAQDVRTVPVPSSKSSSSGKTLLGHLGKSHYLITRSPKAQNKSQISVGLVAGSSQVVFANVAAAGK